MCVCVFECVSYCVCESLSFSVWERVSGSPSLCPCVCLDLCVPVREKPKVFK